MARPLRLQIPGGVYHITSRGNQRQEIFLDDGDRRRFLATLRDVVERMNVLCHSHCLMGNHYHLLLETPDANLSLAIRQLNGVYAQSFNRRYGRVGHLFQGRFGSKLVQKEAYLLIVARYIVLNPVRASLVPGPADWTWSSYLALAGQVEPPPFLTVDWLWSHFDPIDRRTAQEAYRRFVQEGQEDPKQALPDRPILGDAAFVAGLGDQLRSAAPLKDIPRAERFASRPTLAKMFAGYQDRRDRNIRIRTAHLDHGYTMTDIAKHLGLHLMTISRAIHKKLKCET